MYGTYLSTSASTNLRTIGKILTPNSVLLSSVKPIKFFPYFSVSEPKNSSSISSFALIVKPSFLIEVEEMELAKLESKTTTKTDLQESLFQIEKIQGVRYNPKEITVYDFFKLAKLVSKKQA